MYHEMIMLCLLNHYPHLFLPDTLFFFFYRNSLTVLDALEGRTHTISLPINLKTVFLVAEDKWLLVESKTNQWVNLFRVVSHRMQWFYLIYQLFITLPGLSSLYLSFNNFRLGQHLYRWEVQEDGGREN
jgi:hypothetical protein